jgi:hypothetical protein
METRITFAAVCALAPLLLGACANPESVQASGAGGGRGQGRRHLPREGARARQEPYDACRNSLANAAAEEAARQEQRRIEFQKTLGAGTEDYTGR